jgi:outer membrane lipoprotein-sorting protein
MKFVHRSGCAAALALPLLLAGCSLFPTTRHLPAPKPATVNSATPQELVNQINQTWDALNSMTATVEIQGTETKTAEGVQTVVTSPSFHANILIRKPKMLRVRGTDFGLMVFDMASDGSHLTVLIPHDNTAYEGPNTVKEKSANPFLNLRPDFFLDAMAVRGLDPGNEYMVAGDSETIEDTARKHLYIEQEYTLSVMQPKAGPEKLPLRVITFHRDDMLPYDQDIYDSDGNLETQITYSNYELFTSGDGPSKMTVKFPSKITIKHLQDGVQLQVVLTVDDVNKNIDLSDSQFQVKIPEGTKIQQLK